MSTTIRTDNENAPVEYETIINKIVEVSSSYPTTTVRSDAGGATTESTMVIHTGRKECQ